MRIPLTGKAKGKFATVDEADFAEVSKYKWYLNNRGYPTHAFWIDGKSKNISLHRFLLGSKEGKVCDHINRDKLDNQRSNLRFVTNGENMWNRGNRNKKSGYFGVYWRKDSKKWYARLIKNRVEVYFEGFRTALEAAHAYDREAIKHRGELTHLNFPQI